MTSPALTQPAPDIASPQSEPVTTMLDSPLIQRERLLLRGLVRAAADRAKADTDTRTSFQSRNEAAETEYHEVRQRIDNDYQTGTERTEQEYQEARREIAARYEAEKNGADKDYAKSRQRALQQFHTDKEHCEKEWQDSRWTINALLEGNKTKAEGRWQEAQRKMTANRERIETIRQEVTQILGEWVRPDARNPAAEPAEVPEEDTLRVLKDRMAAADAQLLRGQNLTTLKVIGRERLIGLVMLFTLFVWSYLAWKQDWYVPLAVVTVSVMVLGIVGRTWLYNLTRRQAAGICHPLCQALAEAETLGQRYEGHMATSYERQLARDQQSHDTALQQAEEKYHRETADIHEQRDTALRQAEERHQALTDEITSRRDTTSHHADENYSCQAREIKERYETDSAQINEHYQRLLSDNKATHEEEFAAMVEHWQSALAQAEAATNSINQETQSLFPQWDSAAWNDWQPRAAVPPALRFGEFHIALDHIRDGIPQEEQLKKLGPSQFTLPALLSSPDRCSVLFKTSDAGRTVAEQALQLVMFRLLTAFPPAKVRFTIIDPVGLGQSFAAFMHLADHDEALVTSRIWTEHSHIEQRLTDLTAHMENVIQKYLRNQYQTIEEYNAHAGEVAEPFRFLVVANFPANFSPEAARRLASIAASGPRCGVHTLITVDLKQPLPQSFDLKDLEQHSVNVVWKDGKFLWKDPEFARFPFRLDAPPEADFTTRILQTVGKRAREASRVEVPFEFISPSPNTWWTQTAKRGIDVPLGRSDATKRQHLILGQGTAQHVLIAGKTGSGKSTLLHALITNISLMYSPDEVELYLVDFKEGVEFKAYAAYELPHARLVAIESEREFGLSVLQRLEAELKNRGDKFRALGVQDLNSYRQANGKEPMPRILLIVDEFQLFFVDDDKIAQEAALLLDRLVRQGRAFGIHVLLGSQTLGGAYSLARSTIGQMAVRIALQCSEADAHLILSDDNPAARLLSRPGEAIYNDANGLVEGNDFFQVVWLSEEKREDYLRRIRDVAHERGHVPPQPQIVFEGKAPADVRKNHRLGELLHSPTWPSGPRVAQAWLGEAMAIKDPTAAPFRRQSGSNLIMVGQFEEAALGVLTTALVSLAAQHPPVATESNSFAGVRFFVLDGSPVDSPHVGYLARLGEIVPQPLKCGGWRELPAILGELAAELDRRQKMQEGEAAPAYVFIYSLQRFRDLRRQDDDFGFSRRGEDKPPSPSKLFSTILRDGPAAGIHTLIWCDTLNNVNRTLDRQGLREFEMRVLFQMSAADSSNLIDSPLASKLGLHRALFYSEDRGQPEKFRPYGLPSDEWLANVRELLARKKT
jgi:hypothetical protein